MAEIGKRIKEKRELLGITQEELANRLGYKNKSTIAKIEAGTNDIVQSKVIDFANALDTTVSYLMGWSDETNSSSKKATVHQVVLSEDEQKLINLWNNATEESRKTVIMVLESNQAIKKDEAM